MPWKINRYLQNNGVLIINSLFLILLSIFCVNSTEAQLVSAADAQFLEAVRSAEARGTTLSLQQYRLENQLYKDLIDACNRDNPKELEHHIAALPKIEKIKSDRMLHEALKAAAECSNVESCKILIENKADISRIDPTAHAMHPKIWHSPDFMSLPLQNKALACSTFLIKAKADVNKEDHNATTPLFRAARVGIFEYCKILLEYGAEVNPIKPLAVTPYCAWPLKSVLNSCKETEQSRILDLLLCFGAKIFNDFDRILPLQLTNLIQKNLQRNAKINAAHVLLIIPFIAVLPLINIINLYVEESLDDVITYNKMLARRNKAKPAILTTNLETEPENESLLITEQLEPTNLRFNNISTFIYVRSMPKDPPNALEMT